MYPLKPSARAVAAALLAVVAVTTAGADDVEKKWRVSLSVGGFNAQDEIESASANEMFTLNPCIRTLSCAPGAESVVRAFRDPRNDSQVFGNLDLQPATLGTVWVQYGISKIFMIEGSVGYQKGDVGDVEVSVQLPGNGSENPEIIPFNFISQRVSVGEIERVPIRISALARFRPRATFNPYVGLGMGYSIIGFDADSSFNTLSQNIDASRGVQMRLLPFFATTGGGGEALVTDGQPQLDLFGAEIDARDTFEWHIAGGAELTLKRRWALFVDVRWVDASRSFGVGFNNSDELGNSLPNFQPYDDTAMANGRYGPNQVGSCSKDSTGNADQNGEPVSCIGGGLIDFGRIVVVPADEAPALTDCSVGGVDVPSPNCTLDFVFEPDGVPDPGQYFAQGGSLEYDGFALQFGVRFTFGN